MAASPSSGPGRPDDANVVAGTAPARDRRLLFACLACTALIALDVALVVRNRGLVRRVEELGRELARAPRPPLAPGEPLPALALVDGASRPVALLDPDTVGTLLLVSSAGCDACADVEEGWDAATDRAGGLLRILELVVDVEPSALPSAGPGRIAVASGGDAWTLLGRLPGVPAALLVDAQGVVRRAFFGPSQPGLVPAVEELLD